MLIEKEELQLQLVEYYVYFVRVYIELNELKKVGVFIQRVDEMWFLYGGEEYENVDGMFELWKQFVEVVLEMEDD